MTRYKSVEMNLKGKKILMWMQPKTVLKLLTSECIWCASSHNKILLFLLIADDISLYKVGTRQMTDMQEKTDKNNDRQRRASWQE